MFSDVIGQDMAVTTLSRCILEDRLAGTYLFTGPAGVGKSTLAREFAKALNCQSRLHGVAEPCGRCTACRSIESDKHPDVRSVAPTGPSRILRMAQIWPRDGVKEHPPEAALLRDLHYGPVSGNKRVFIIEDADCLNQDTANSLLKALEDTPPYALFILTAPSPQALLPTICSRSQVIRFGLVAQSSIERELAHRTSLSDSDRRFLAAYVEGRIGRALSLAARPAVLEGRKQVLGVAQLLTSSLPQISALKLADELRKHAGSLAWGQDEADKAQRTLVGRALDLLLLWYGDIQMYRVCEDKAILVNEDMRPSIEESACRLTLGAVEDCLARILQARRYVERNANIPLVLEVLTTSLMSLRSPAPA